MKLYGNRVFQRIGLALFEGDQLYTDTFQAVEIVLAEFFQENLCVWFHDAIVTADPAIVLPVHIVEEQIIIAVVDEIGLIAAVLHHLSGLYRKISQIDVEAFSFRGFRHLLFFGLWLRLFGLRGRRLRRLGRRERGTA